VKSWDQQEGESDNAFKAFQLWCEHSESVRNLFDFRLVLRDNGITFTEDTIEAYRARYQWEKRKKRRANWLRMKTDLRIAEKTANAKTAIMEKRSEAVGMAVDLAMNYLSQLPSGSIVDSDSKTVAVISEALDATRKAVEVIGLSCVDSDDLARELAKRIASKVAGRRKARKPEPDPEELCELPGQSDEVQPGSLEAS